MQVLCLRWPGLSQSRDEGEKGVSALPRSFGT